MSSSHAGSPATSTPGMSPGALLTTPQGVLNWACSPPAAPGPAPLRLVNLDKLSIAREKGASVVACQLFSAVPSRQEVDGFLAAVEKRWA
ncbi:hypothetical protein HYH02_007362 [Chlamydomonas schloesseri]|uniref:Uncharacterized protein n=1 Tax=Chlamydomonas schloesseri TaxID=2026947 RepID=A0A836B5D1_9CHLO|nr:hypothetical protein HYH02_007362 [Chlamydomonas schloesseri]|eukprot:KAG2447908.1 hypothetical protein HYH02_007362 [Chlamydomonas schloesseri]